MDNKTCEICKYKEICKIFESVHIGFTDMILMDKTDVYPALANSCLYFEPEKQNKTF